jgi:hypothetical protein
MGAGISTELECRITDPDAFATEGYPHAEWRCILHYRLN